MGSDNYRMDNRTPEEFKKEIKAGTLKENVIMERWIATVEFETGVKHKYTRKNELGSDGEFLEIENVTAEADFIVESFGLIEVKFANPKMVKNCHLKVSQVNRYIKDNASVLLINGLETDNAQYCLMDIELLEHIKKTCKIVLWRGFGNKRSFQIPIDTLLWSDLL